MNPKMDNKPKKSSESKIIAQPKTPEIRIKSQGKVESIKISDLKDIESILNNHSVDQGTIIKKAKLSNNPNNALQSYGTGRRKNAIARVWIKAGNGNITVNKKVGKEYFTRESHLRLIFAPLFATKTDNIYDIVCTVKGGGSSGQAGAIQHGLARALNTLLSDDMHLVLRQGGFLTRDSRVVERKKYGQPKARKNFQFSKR